MPPPPPRVASTERMQEEDSRRIFSLPKSVIFVFVGLLFAAIAFQFMDTGRASHYYAPIKDRIGSITASAVALGGGSFPRWQSDSKLSTDANSNSTSSVPPPPLSKTDSSEDRKEDKDNTRSSPPMEAYLDISAGKNPSSSQKGSKDEGKPKLEKEKDTESKGTKVTTKGSTDSTNDDGQLDFKVSVAWDLPSLFNTLVPTYLSEVEDGLIIYGKGVKKRSPLLFEMSFLAHNGTESGILLNGDGGRAANGVDEKKGGGNGKKEGRKQRGGKGGKNKR